MSTTSSTLPTADLNDAYNGSYYTIAGAGGDPQEWVDGVNGLLTEKGIGTPTGWFQTTGAAVNEFAGELNHPTSAFPDDLTILMFPLDGLAVGALAIFKIQMQDRWFDDVIDNMRAERDDDELD